MVGIVQNKRLFIVGAGSFGREMESWLELVPVEDRDWELAGYLDNLPIGDLPYPSDYKVLGNEREFSFSENDAVIIAVSDPNIREKIYNDLYGRVQILSFISSNSIIGKFTKISEGSIICPNCLITTNVVLGKCVVINTGSQIGHDVYIGDFTSVMANVDIAGKCNIGNKVFIGSNVTIIPGRKIADENKIGAGSIVVTNIKKSGITVFGNPAKPL